ncbi:MAG: sulfatase-like hydrolase/transferase [Planctomycetota bacterium]
MRFPINILALLLTCGTMTAASRPNIVFILADDYGIDNIGAYGSDVYADATPNLDRLAAEGMLFTNTYCHPKCGVTRACLQTGQYPFRNGSVGKVGQVHAREHMDSLPKIADILGSAGYATGSFGKSETDGFQEWLETGGGYWKDAVRTHAGDVDLGKLVWNQDTIMQYALDFIERNQNGPFYCYIPLNLPHVPLDPSPDMLHATGFPYIAADDSLDLARYQQDHPGATADDLIAAMRAHVDGQDTYSEMNRLIDQTMADVLDKLAALGIDENTVVLFSGDNGSAKPNSLRVAAWDWRTVQYRGIDGGKDSYGDGGGHVPFLLRWPEAVAGGQRIEHLVDFTDLLVTFADLAEAELPDGAVFDGNSLAPLLLGQPFIPREFIYVQRGPIYWLRTEGYRMDYDGRFYDIDAAPFDKMRLDTVPLTAEQESARQRLDHLLNTVLDPRHGLTYEAASDAWQDNAYWAWKSRYWQNFLTIGLTSQSGDASDPDGDGWPNLFEMAFDTVPTDAASLPTYGYAEVAALDLGTDISPNTHVVVQRVDAAVVTDWGTVGRSFSDGGQSVYLRAQRSDLSWATEDRRALVSDYNPTPSAPVDADNTADTAELPVGAAASVGVTAQAADADTVYYHLLDDADGLFQIDVATGVVTTTRELNDGDVGSHQITVLANDATTDAEPVTFTIIVQADLALHFQAQGVSHEEILLNWVAPAASDWYLLQRSNDSNDDRLMVRFLSDGQQESYSDRGLLPAQRYHYQLQAGTN